MTPAGMTPADLNWFAVLAHHAGRTPDKVITVFEGEETTYGEMAGRAAALAGGLSRHGVAAGRRRGAALVQLPRVPGGPVRRQLPRRDRHADQLAAGGPRGAVHPRALRSSRPRVRRGAGGAGNEATQRPRSDTLLRACVSPTGGTDGRPWPTCGAPRRGRPGAGDGRRRAPLDVHVGHHGTPEGGDDHPCQPGLEEHGPHHRVRLHERRSRAGLRSALSRRVRSTSRRPP